jgi:hypothetical protein
MDRFHRSGALSRHCDAAFPLRRKPAESISTLDTDGEKDLPSAESDPPLCAD